MLQNTFYYALTLISLSSLLMILSAPAGALFLGLSFITIFAKKVVDRKYGYMLDEKKMVHE
ncbi:hypothetical protein [Bacillus sp. 1P06AnD]|uniref:hypothetical protein n=1 Tax=Bacillus sp. 1P06AnD TaxID=3132208 RepID=UPI0039A3A92D